MNFHLSTGRSNVRDDFVSTSPTSNAKVNPSVRAPRSGSGIAPKFSPVVQRAVASNDWDMSNCTNKPTAGGGVSNRKRMTSMRSSSPPVSHWASQRPQKISRIARRTNLVPIVSSNDDNPLDNTFDVVGNDTGLGFGRRMSGSSPQQVKIKGEPLSSAAQSESEESGAAEIKSREKTRKSDDLDDKSEQCVQKVPALVLATRKNKLVDEDIGNGVRRQGRTGRAFTSTRSLMPMTVEKNDAVGTAKQLRSARLGFDKVERLDIFCLHEVSSLSKKCHCDISFIFKFSLSFNFHSARQVVHLLGNLLTARHINVKSIQQSMWGQIFLVLYFSFEQQLLC